MNLLEREIQDDISERTEQMITLKTMSSRYSYNKHDEQFILNYSIPIVYSIWEGFVQNSFQYYIRELNKLNLPLDIISDHILVYTMETSFKQLYDYPQQHRKKINYFKKMMSFFKSDAPISIRTEVNTESNVGFDVINKLLERFNLKKILEYPSPGYSLKEELDDFLLKIRNGVSHGNYAYIINRSELERAIVVVEVLMNLVFDSIKEGYSNNIHLLNNIQIEAAQ